MLDHLELCLKPCSYEVCTKNTTCTCHIKFSLISVQEYFISIQEQLVGLISQKTFIL